MQEKKSTEVNCMEYISEPEGVYESNLHREWNNTRSGKICKCNDGKSIEVLSHGIWNTGAGPDFLNAKMKTENKILRGDIEIHYRASDWYRHNHHNDPAYKNVILHAVCVDDMKDRDPAHPPITVIKIPEVNTKINEAAIAHGKCADYFASLGENGTRLFFIAAGRTRFKMKSERMAREMLETGAESSFLKNFFDAAGYKKNRETFLKLFERFSQYPKEFQSANFEDILWCESGLLPDPAAASGIEQEMLDFIKKRWDNYWKIRIGGENKIKWQRSATRPLNSPERMLASICLLIAKTDGRPLYFFTKKAKSASPPEEMSELILKTLSDKKCLWCGYSSFSRKLKHPAAVTGQEKALETTVNVILPAIHAHAVIEKDRKLAASTENAWLSLPATQDNRILKTSARKWLKSPLDAKTIFASAAACQGAIHIYREFCERTGSDCKSCLISNSNII
ncbi:MAG: hypothetical protein A2017_00315 [Lentisphaerae bacterium GWF2_44_16]|nr:MAG: hypothetical protein A2017_00315 [Lentisphaerae bacterium GWF2_44_16]